MDRLRFRAPGEIEFHQAVQEIIDSVRPALDKNPEFGKAKILERITAPELVIIFSVPWMDDRGEVHVNTGYRIGMNSALGPYQGGLRFHPSVNLSILKFLALQQVMRNALTTMPLGGGKGGSDFDPKGKSDNEMMQFCQSYMRTLFRHMGPNTDIPSADVGVGPREIGYLFGMYKKLRNEFSGAFTGKNLSWGGSLMRPEATGYSVAYFAQEMLATRNQELAGKTCLVSGAGNVALHVAEKIISLGGKVITLSDSGGYIYDEEGLDHGKLAFVKNLKTIQRARISEYAHEYSNASYTPFDPQRNTNPLWNHWADCAFPCAAENEIGEEDAYHLINQGIKVIAEGADMPCTPEAVRIFHDKNILHAPAKATGAGGAAVAGLEMAQNSMRLSWTREEVDARLQTVVKTIHRNCLNIAAAHGAPANYHIGANIAGFVRIVSAMMDQGIV
jgi:glutamate dehydrogenase (NADP+)